MIVKVIKSIKKSIFYYFSVLNRIKKYNKFNYSVNYYLVNENELGILCEKYGTDKGTSNSENVVSIKWGRHNYTDIYDQLFFDKRDDFKKVFELGIGTNDESFRANMGAMGQPGASLRVWRGYFKNARIYGADIDKNILFEEDRINTYYVDQTSKESINLMWDNCSEKDFDLIIDDGKHTFNSSVSFFENSISKISKFGYYIIEDVSTKNTYKFMNHLSKFDYKVIVVRINYPNNPYDNNLIIIRK